MTVIAGPWPTPTDGQLLAGRVHAWRAGLPTIGRGALPTAVIVDELAGLRWEDDGGPALDDGRPSSWPPPAWLELGARLAELGRAVVDGMRRLAEAAGRTWRQLVEAVNSWCRVRRTFTPAPGRWRTDVPPRRWRDWQPSPERPVDRARRQRLARQLAHLERRATRRARRGGAA